MLHFLPTDILIECVPNFSEGRNQEIIDSIADAIKSTSEVKLLHVDVGYDANRTVYTFVGKPMAVIQAAYLAIKIASEQIDMQQHKGKHPRMGACDVCPLIPLQNISIEETATYAKQLATMLSTLDIPIFMYEASANNEFRKNLANIRKGEYEAIAQKMMQKEWQPDFGNFKNYQKFGMMALGARKFLIAYNINLATKDLNIGKKIAQVYRQDRKQNTALQYAKTIAWYIEEYNCVQISTNITDFENTNIGIVFNYVQHLANKENIKTNGSELIGLIPKAALLFNKKASHTEDEAIDMAIQYLGLDALQPFNKKERILEYLL